MRSTSGQPPAQVGDDNTLDRHETMVYASAIAFATNLPVSADLENGFGDAPDVVAEIVRPYRT